MISIIIPTYNCGTYLIRALTSLEGQTYKDFEVVIVDDGSTDNTQELLDQYQRLFPPYPIKKIKQEHKGNNFARNEGFKHASGEYLLFLDADDTLVAHALETYIKALEDNQEKAYAYCYFDRDGHIHQPGEFDAAKLRSGELLINTTSLLRRESFPGFDENLKRLQDWDLWLTVLNKKGEGVLIPEVLFYTFARVGDVSSTESLEEANAYVRKKHHQGVLDEPTEPLETQGLVDIIILGFGTPEGDKKCLNSIFENTDYPYYKITWYDNYKYKYSISRAWNRLIEQTDGQYICLLHNDTEVTKGWLTQLIVTLNDQSVGAVGPSFDKCLDAQKVDPKKLPQKRTLINMEKEYGKAFQLSGICLVIPRRVWNEAGKFNEKFYLFPESEFLHRVQTRYYKTIWRKDIFIKHFGGLSRKKREKEEHWDFMEERRKANKLYVETIKGSREDL